MNWKITLLLLLHGLRSINSSSQKCSQSIANIVNSVTYNYERRELTLPFVQKNETLDCLKTRRDAELVVEMFSVADWTNPVAKCCSRPCEFTRLVEQVTLTRQLDNHSISYVEGKYYMRFRSCSCSTQGNCYRCKTLKCSEAEMYGKTDISVPTNQCGNQSSAFLTKVTRYAEAEVVVEAVLDAEALLEAEALFAAEESQTDNCTLMITALFSACSAILPYSKANVIIHQVRKCRYLVCFL